MTRDLENKTAIVTGAGSGIGRAVALAYARNGANVVVSDIDEDSGRETARMIGERALFVRGDAGSPDDHESLVRQTMERFGALHVACNNAGIGGVITPLHELTIEGWRKVIDVDLSGVFYAMRAQIPHMLATGGAIVNLASIFGAVGRAGASAYVSAKHGVIGLTKSAALDYAPHGIRINCVGPAYIDTPMVARLPEERRNAAVALHALGRFGKPEEVAELIAWLSSDRASFVTGAFYPIDGGFLAQ